MARQTFSLLLGIISFQIICVLGSNCNWHYYEHYEQKGCTPVLGNDGCPVRFQCKELSPEDYKSCIHDGKIYRDREDILSVGACNHCKCKVNSWSGMAHIECASFDCPQWVPENKTCYMGYKPGDCCPKEMCPGDKGTGKTCTFDGKSYDIGTYVDIPVPCQKCICTEDWTGVDGPGCSRVNCMTGIYAEEIRKGCLPIYSSKGCCSFQTYCDKLSDVNPVPVSKAEVKNDYCTYQGAYYSKGTSAQLNTNGFKCVTCTCTTPPDFTCVMEEPCS